MNVAVLGSSGQIGTHLVEHLRSKEGYNVVSYDIVPSATTTHEHNLADPGYFNIRSLQGIDFVYFLAFDVGGSRYLKQYQHTADFMYNNISLMTNVFGNMSYSPYGLLKNIGEHFTKALDGVVVKFWNVYGVEHDKDKAHVITDFIYKARDHKLIDMMTDGTEVRQFLHADDCSRCLEALALKYESINRDKELHVTNFEWNTILEIAEIIADNFPGCKIAPSENRDDLQRDKRNDPDTHILEYWKPEISLREGIQSIIKQL